MPFPASRHFYTKGRKEASHLELDDSRTLQAENEERVS